jgi:hypothetical protein
MSSTTTPLSASSSKSPDPTTAQPTSIVTQLTLAVSPEQAWETLMFYEQIDRPPPLHLRLLLPVPVSTKGRKSEVGDQALCLYKRGHLIKRVTHVDRGRHYGFEVVEQQLGIGGGMRLFGGDYTLRELPGGRTEVVVSTRYTSPRRPRWLWKPLEVAVCHMFHRHILRAMRRRALAQPAAGQAGVHG